MKLGDKFESKNFGLFEIIKIENSRGLLIRFDNTGYVTKVRADVIRSGNIRDRLAKTVCDVGYLGEKDYSGHPLYSKLYSCWSNMIKRCYSDKVQKDHPTYTGCSVHHQWHNLSNFIEWCLSREDFSDGQFELDKDILFKNNKVYSPETCCFVPPQINNLFVKRNKLRGEYPIGVTKVTRNRFRAQCQDGKGNLVKFPLVDNVDKAFGQYKAFKEAVVRECANNYKEVLTVDVYHALLAYSVERSD